MKSTEDLHDWAKHYNATGCRDILMFADAIEAELAERYIALPLDAEGMPIHVGDSIEIIGGEYGTAVAIELCEDGGWNVSMRPTGWDTPTLFAAESVRHCKPPTVEDILTEFHERMDELGTTDQCVGIDRADAVDALLRERDEMVAEYAAKLRLAGDGK